jgi:hypothetical protein
MRRTRAHLAHDFVRRVLREKRNWRSWYWLRLGPRHFSPHDGGIMAAKKAAKKSAKKSARRGAKKSTRKSAKKSAKRSRR